ncbi:hypothetical protein VL20_1137 [Microcystis panniformis FACHB-1757]|uniref:Uncharacterized protein n=1 Tax=Microcystis panniformis FACHB-1757 TaxID=1638788 RepID=A0A0K1RWP8_9CHRO|nr:hypothetical protein VL20_1137 [Microcystis panniformis FACHB-1757]
MRLIRAKLRSQYSGVSPDEKIFTTTDERGFLPYTLHPAPPHPTPCSQSV